MTTAQLHAMEAPTSLPISSSSSSSSPSAVFRPHRSDDWQRYRPVIEQLYRHDQLKLKDVKRYMERNHNFLASEKQYKDRLAAWRVRKNVKAKEVHTMLRKQHKRAAQGKATAFRVGGQVVDSRRISRFVRRYGMSEIDVGGDPNDPEPETPPDMTCFTPEPEDRPTSVREGSMVPGHNSHTKNESISDMDLEEVPYDADGSDSNGTNKNRSRSNSNRILVASMVSLPPTPQSHLEQDQIQRRQRQSLSQAQVQVQAQAKAQAEHEQQMQLQLQLQQERQRQLERDQQLQREQRLRQEQERQGEQEQMHGQEILQIPNQLEPQPERMKQEFTWDDLEAWQKRMAYLFRRMGTPEMFLPFEDDWLREPRLL